MKQNTILNFINQNREFLFPNSEYTEEELITVLTAVPEEYEYALENINFKDPRLYMLLAITPLDRIFLKNYVLGVLKFLTTGGMGIWTIIDIFTAKKRCRTFNCKALLEIVKDPSPAGQIGNTTVDNIDMDKAIHTAKVLAPQAKKLGKSFKEFTDTL